MYFQELFIWLEREHQLSQLIDAPGGSCWLLEPLWASMVALGGPWRKYKKTIVLFCKTDTFHSQGYSECLPRSIFWIIQNAWRLSFCRLLDPRPENHKIKPHGAGFDDFWNQDWKVMAQYYIEKHFVIGSLFIGSSVRGSSAYYSPSQRGTHEKYVSMEKA